LQLSCLFKFEHKKIIKITLKLRLDNLKNYHLIIIAVTVYKF
jgi:hypothetical protein